MDIRLGIQLPRRLDKGVDEVVVCLAPNALLPQAQVEVVIQQFLVVGATVEDDGERPVGVNAGAERGEGELRDRDEDAPDSLVADAEYLLSI